MKRSLLWVILLLVATMSRHLRAQDDRVLLDADEKRFSAPGVLELPFDLPDLPQDQQVRLSVDVRNEAPEYYGGFTYWLGVSVNGVALAGPDLLNKRFDFSCRNGFDVSWAQGSKWLVVYAPDFSDAPITKPNTWGFFPEDEPYHFVWDITSRVKPGRNVMAFNNPKILTQNTAIVLRNLRVEIGKPIKAKSSPAPAPASGGELATYVARASNRPVDMKVQLSPSGSLRAIVAGRTFDIISRTSEPEGKWIATSGVFSNPLAKGRTANAQWSGTGYKVTRKVSLCEDHVQIADTFTNTSDKVVGVIYQNRMNLPRDDRLKVRLGGWLRCAPTQQEDRPAHPSVIAEMDGLAIGLFAEDDILRVHVRTFAEPGVMGIGDPRLGVGPGKSHTLEWSIYPVVNGSYWDLINAVRRNWGSNFQIPGPFVFDAQAQLVRSQDEINEWIKSRGVNWVCTGQTQYLTTEELDQYGGPYRIDQAEGTAIPLAAVWRKNMTDWVRKVHATHPGVKTMTYLHTEICTEPNAEKLYQDCRLVDANGAPVLAIYQHPVYLYVPTLENPYGKALRKTVEQTIDEAGLDGIYNDQFNFGEACPYGYRLPWDGCSLDIDPNTHAVLRQCSSITLLQLPWKVWMVKYLQDRGKVVLGNDSIHTRTMLKLKVPAFVETGSYAWLIDTHLACPLGLGNHDSDFTTPQSRARMFRRMLDQGGLMATYIWPDEPKSRPFISYMHPITPMEIRAGMILGKERIITNRSGRYGWPDGSRAEVYVFDSEGQLVKSPSVKETRGGKGWLTELRMPSDHFAVLVRKGRG